MFRLSLRNIGDHKGRFLMTALAVIIGVSFVVSSFVLSDTIRQTFRNIFAEANENVDLVVRTTGGFDAGPGGVQRAPLPAEAVELVRQVPGVAEADGPVQGIIPALLDPDGKQVPNNGPPTIGTSWGNSKLLDPLRVAEGKQPSGPDEVALDRVTFEDFGFELNTKVTVQLSSGPKEYTLVGSFRNGDNDGYGGAHVLAFDPPTALAALGRVGQIDKVQVAVAEGTPVATVRAAILEQVPEQFKGNIEVVPGAQVAEEDASTFEILSSVIGNVLLAFAGVALFVSAFYIFNTFNIIVGQRTKELALLRAVGASPRQVRRSVLTESLGLGVVSSIIGLGGGYVLAGLLRSLMNSFGFTLPADEIILKPGTIIIGLVIGIGVTLAASILPAARSSRVKPLAALRDDEATQTFTSRRRLIVGVVMTALGALSLSNGLFFADNTQSTLSSLAFGAIFVFLGVSVLSALVAGRVTSVLGQPVRTAFRTPGRLARDNAARNPQRTSSTASALTIGLALVTMATMVGASLKASFTEAAEGAVRADYFVGPGGGFGFGFSPSVGNDVKGLSAVEATSPVRFNAFRFEGATKQMTGVDPTTAADLFDFGIIEGGYDKLDTNGVLVHVDPARDLGLEVGDEVDVQFPRGGERKLTVAGLFEDGVFSNYVVSTEDWDEKFPDNLDQFVAIKVRGGVSEAELAQQLAPTLDKFPQLSLQDRDEFASSQGSQVDQLLIIINVLLILAVAIAVLGIANTLALSVLERIHEIGLLRAVGMTRRQTRRMVRWEGAIVSAFGATVGVAVGILFGFAALSALPESLITTSVVPIGSLIFLLIFAVVAGLLAAIFPAYRAGRLDVLAAISHE